MDLPEDTTTYQINLKPYRIGCVLDAFGEASGCLKKHAVELALRAFKGQTERLSDVDKFIGLLISGNQSFDPVIWEQEKVSPCLRWRFSVKRHEDVLLVNYSAGASSQEAALFVGALLLSFGKDNPSLLP